MGRSLGEGNGNPLQYSCLGDPMDRRPWWATVCVVTRVRHDLVTKKQQHSQRMASSWLPIPQEPIHSFIHKHFLSTHYGLASGLGLGGVSGSMRETDNCILNCNYRAIITWKEKEGTPVVTPQRWLAQLRSGSGHGRLPGGGDS